jgi:hypothetical protein
VSFGGGVYTGWISPGGRVVVTKYSIRRWGPTHHLPVNAPGRLGYTYPDPIGLPDGRLFLA